MNMRAERGKDRHASPLTKDLSRISLRRIMNMIAMQPVGYLRTSRGDLCKPCGQLLFTKAPLRTLREGF